MDHVTRMAHELHELDARRSALREFIRSNPIYKTLAPEEQWDMTQQQDAMRLYAFSLRRRLNRAAPRAPSVEIVTE